MIFNEPYVRIALEVLSGSADPLNPEVLAAFGIDAKTYGGRMQPPTRDDLRQYAAGTVFEAMRAMGRRLRSLEDWRDYHQQH